MPDPLGDLVSASSPRADAGDDDDGLLAMVVNGDLRVAMTIASVLTTFDTVGAALAAPLSLRARDDQQPGSRGAWR
jgi:hypothetical protein